MEKGHPPKTVKVFFDPMTAILLHQFDGSFPETHVLKHLLILVKVVDNAALFGCGKLDGVNMEKGTPGPNRESLL
jgi:hypothetical protein